MERWVGVSEAAERSIYCLVGMLREASRSIVTRACLDSPTDRMLEAVVAAEVERVAEEAHTVWAQGWYRSTFGCDRETDAAMTEQAVEAGVNWVQSAYSS